MRHIQVAATLLLVGSCASKTATPVAASNTAAPAAKAAAPKAGASTKPAPPARRAGTTTAAAAATPRRVDGALLLAGPLRLGADALAVSRDGKHAAFGLADYTVQVWDLTTRKRVASFRYGRKVTALAISPDGLQVAIGGADEVSLWRRGDKKAASLGKHNGPVNALDFSLDGKMLASGSDEEQAAMWDLTKRRLHRTFFFSAACGGACTAEKRVVAVRFVSKRLLAFGQNSEVKLVHARTGNKVGESRCVSGDSSTCTGIISSNIAVDPRGRFMAFHLGGGCAHLVSYTGWCRRLKPKKKGDPAPRASVAFLPSGELLVPMDSGRFATWTVKGRRRADRVLTTGNSRIAVSAATSQIVSIGASTHALLEPLLAGKGKPVRLGYWSKAPATTVRVAAKSLFFSKDGQYLEGRETKGRPLRWRVGSFALTRPAKLSVAEAALARGIRISGGQKYNKALGISKKRFQRFERISAAMDKSFECCGADCTFPYRAIAFDVLLSPDGKVGAYRDDNNELTFVGLSKATRSRLPSKAKAVLAFRSTRWLALIDENGALEMVDLKTTKTYTLAKHGGEIGTLVLRQLAGGKVLVGTVDSQGEVRVQRLGAKRVFETRPPGGGVAAMLVGPRGKYVVVASNDTSLRVYPLPPL